MKLASAYPEAYAIECHAHGAFPHEECGIVGDGIEAVCDERIKEAKGISGKDGDPTTVKIVRADGTVEEWPGILRVTEAKE